MERKLSSFKYYILYIYIKNNKKKLQIFSNAFTQVQYLISSAIKEKIVKTRSLLEMKNSQLYQ